MKSSNGAASMSLGPLAIVWGLLCGFAAGGLATVGDPMGYRIGYTTGATLVLFLISLFFAWVVWTANGRREGGGRLTFAAVALLLASAQALFHTYQTSTFGVIAAMQPALDAEAAALTREVQNPGLRHPGVDAIVERLAAELEVSTRQIAAGPNKDLVLALRGIRRVIARGELTYAAAVYAFIEVDVLNFAGLEGVEGARLRGRICKEFAQQNEDYLAYLGATPQLLERSIADISMNDVTRSSVHEGFTRTLTDARAKVAPVVTARVEFARHIARLFKHLEDTADNWEVDDAGKILFQGDAELERFNAIAAEVDAAQSRLVKIESGVVNPEVPDKKTATKVHGAG